MGDDAIGTWEMENWGNKTGDELMDSGREHPMPSQPRSAARPIQRGATATDSRTAEITQKRKKESSLLVWDQGHNGHGNKICGQSCHSLGLSFNLMHAQGDPLRDDLRRLLADTGATVFDVTKYGAVADGKTDNVEAFMKTWLAACHWRGTSTVLIPEGKFLVGQATFEGPCNSPNPIVFEARGTVLAQPDLSEYPSPECINDCHQNADCQMLPTDITSLDSKSFHYFITNSYNFTAFNLTITAPGNSPNTDGMHLSRCDLVNLSNFTIKTGDDCISVGQGSTNINITNVYCGPGHGLSIGSLGKYPNEKDVVGIHVTNCTLNGTTNGARIKTWPGSPPSQASSIIFQDIVMNSVKNPILIDQKYGSHTGKPSRVKVSDVLYKNLRGTTISKVAVSLVCSELVPCNGLQLEDIDFTYNGPATFKENLPFSSTCLHANASYVGKQNPPACA
ncbi:Exopolygalacturonase clone GBGE184 [Vitis vinifera]|uniref:Exopolygalacturonase clone GBGE184 n=1 Tax=Vitis vinifera TaxID=29760 RepID=A0A438F3I3_VITVI|nr:Exopolygalacturonase clone GBGE184 [Vitis vinifera]